MTSLLNIIATFFLFIVVLTVSAKNSGNTNKLPISNNVIFEKLLGVINTESDIYTGTKRKSELKCEEYESQFSICFYKCKTVNTLVIRGEDVRFGELPHMAALGKIVDETFTLICGGALIAPEWILTAAHCTYGSSIPTHVRLGLVNLKNNQEGITVAINKMIYHPNYKPPYGYADIALIKLNTPVTFNCKIKPACLYQQYDTIPRNAWVSGWGATEFGGEFSNKLQKAFLSIIDNISCTIRYNQSIVVPYGITPKMFCAADVTSNWTKDSCQGDSGGPMQIVNPKNRCLFQVFGITSFGIGCAFNNTPGVYTRVSHYLDWIEDIVWL